MFCANQVMLCGNVLSELYIKKFNSSYGMTLVFDFMTQEQWSKTRQHVEYHRILVRDGPHYKLASIYEKVIKPGVRLLVSGHLRSKMLFAQDGQKLRITEIEAESIEPLSDEIKIDEALNNREIQGAFEKVGEASLPPDKEAV